MEINTLTIILAVIALGISIINLCTWLFGNPYQKRDTIDRKPPLAYHDPPLTDHENKKYRTNISYFKLSLDDLELLEKQNIRTLIKWNLELNIWEWPDDIPNPEKAGYVKDGRRSRIMDWIENKLGDWIILRVHNCHMTDEEYADFYNGTLGGDKEADKRYKNRNKNESMDELFQKWERNKKMKEQIFSIT